MGRARGIRLPADVSVRTAVRDGFRDIEVDIGAERLTRLAFAGRIPPELHHALREHARFLIVSLSTTIDDLRVQRTRSQLRHELMVLLRALRSGGDMPIVPPWLRSEIEGYFIRFRLDLPYGQAPTITLDEAAIQVRGMEKARAEVRAAFSGANELAAVVADVLRFLKRSPPYRRERVASSSSMRPELKILLGWIEHFWLTKLRHAPTMSTELRAFSDEVFRMCGVQISGLSLERHLQEMIRAAAKSKA
jgi:hypothetical protein